MLATVFIKQTFIKSAGDQTAEGINSQQDVEANHQEEIEHFFLSSLRFWFCL